MRHAYPVLSHTFKKRCGLGTSSSGTTRRSQAIIIERFASLAALEAVRQEWAALCSRTDTTPFQSPAWLIPWWRHLGVGSLETLGLRRAGELIAIAPLYIYPNPHSNTRDVLIVGCGTSDYLDVVCEPGSEAHVRRAVFEHLKSERLRWDRCEFTQLRAGSPLFRGEVPRGWIERSAQGEPCVRLPLDSGKHNTIASLLPKRMLQNLRYYRRRADKLGTIHIRCASRSDLEQHFENLVRLHALRWSTRGEAGVLANAGVLRAHREALPGLLEADVLRLYSLAIGERIIAVFYGLSDGRAGGSMYYYLGAFDPEFEQVSPGSLLIAHALEQALAEGASAFDFLRGRESYKYLWGARDCPTHRRELRLQRATA
jgi:CelD/BcsL family acetyltransferase involved in cellulose biosynthesis